MRRFDISNLPNHYIVEIQKLNVYIDEYNEIKDDSIGRKKLESVIKQQEVIQQKFPLFYRRHFNLFNENLMQAYKEHRNRISFPMVFSQMDTQKIVSLIEAALDGVPLTDVYQNETSDEANLFKLFFTPKENGGLGGSITRLGGENSKNFKVSVPGQSDLVLRLDNRLGATKECDTHLEQEGLGDIFLNVHDVRPLSGRRFINKSARIIDYCKQGDLLSSRGHKEDNKSIRKNASNYFGQIATIINRMQEKQVAFTDMKNENWLLADDGTVKIADTKSFLFVDDDGLIRRDSDKNYATDSILSTQHITPPEIQKDFSADKMHSFMFGKILYQYLTGCDVDTLSKLGRAKKGKISFDHDVFKTPLGKKFKSIIEKTVRYDPESRLSMNQIDEKLKNLSNVKKSETILKKIEALNYNQKLDPYIESMQSFISEAKDPETVQDLESRLKKDLDNLKQRKRDRESMYERLPDTLKQEITATQRKEISIKEDDVDKKLTRMTNGVNKVKSILQNLLQTRSTIDQTKIEEYVLKQRKILDQVQNEKALSDLSNELDRTLKIITKVTDITENFRKSGNKITPWTWRLNRQGKLDKAEAIEKAMKNLKIEEISSLENMESNEQKAVWQALAEHRHFFRFKTPTITKDNEHRAAKSFHQFKESFKELKRNEPTIETPEETAEEGLTKKI